MRRALGLAATASATDDVPVAAGRRRRRWNSGRHRRQRPRRRGDPTAHAEIVALRDAARSVGRWRLEGCTLVVTLEPCTMCAGAIVQSRVARLVFGAFDDKAGAVGSLWDVVRDRRLHHRPEVVSGVLAAESAALLREFFAGHRRDAP
ncbi:MAG: nucleoside deaminase [Nocardioidaceae bacterium]